MSHFSVLVITPKKPTKTSLAAILQPWHEFECTGVEDRYVIDVDVTDQVVELWGEAKDVVRRPDGSIASRYSNEFYTKSSGTKDFMGKPEMEFELPAGCTLETVSQAVLSLKTGETQEEFAREYGGWVKRGDRYYDRTNPNKKWDWWMVGGRWTGHFKPGYDPDQDPTKRETCWLCGGTGTRLDMISANGCNGCRGSGVKTTWPTQWKAMDSDQLPLGDIPVAELRAHAEQEAAKKFDLFERLRAGRTIKTWAEVQAEYLNDSNTGRTAYHAQPALQDIRKAKEFEWLEPERYACDRATFIKRAGDGAMSTFAVVKDGQWFERGKMGWWACVSGEKDKDAWNEEFAKLIDGLPPTTWLTVVDCHI